MGQGFEDLVIWQGARKLACGVYQLCRETDLGRDWNLRDQLCRAAVSVMSNIAEGKERNRDTEFHHFLAIAKGSCGEVRSLLHLALDVGLLAEGKASEWIRFSAELSFQIGSMMSKTHS
ncbi:MAG: four helix bundle protein [Lentisphaeria bacterium]|jgi:four helix bundle protein